MELEQRVLRFKHKDVEYKVVPRDITAARLRQFKSWFGKDYGAYLPFMQMTAQLDADAVCCAMWTARTKAGDSSCLEANRLDFNVDDLLPLHTEEEITAAAVVDDESEERPTEPVSETPEPPATTTTDSGPTASSSSSPSTSSISQISAD